MKPFITIYMTTEKKIKLWKTHSSSYTWKCI